MFELHPGIPRHRRKPEDIEVPELPDFDLIVKSAPGDEDGVDSRHNSPKALIYWDEFTGGMLAAFQAAYDKLVSGKKAPFDDLRERHQRFIDLAKESDPASTKKAGDISPQIKEQMMETFKDSPLADKLSKKVASEGNDDGSRRRPARNPAPAGGTRARANASRKKQRAKPTEQLSRSAPEPILPGSRSR